ncbi:MAG: hypothetical protein MI861_03860 [Pirellulales bacterium]|nr:hypothetical protein [Pirellulales bacterium]
MNRIAVLTLFVLPALFPSVATAQRVDNSGLFIAACRYREAVVNFEQLVIRVRGIERIDERLVDKFEEATRRLRLATKNPRHSSRLRNEWRKIQPLQDQVEARIFGKYTYNHILIEAWELVLFHQILFEQEYLFQLDNSRHGSRVQRRISTSSPNRFLPPPQREIHFDTPTTFGGVRILPPRN